MKIDIDKLTIPIYLNTKIVFDMLATIEDGFSEMKSVQTSNIKSKGEEVNAEIGTQNVFSLLKIGIGANKKRTDSEEETISEEKTHTTVSLFQKLKAILEENQFIKQQDADALLEGDFVEIKGTLKPNPVIDLLENFKELMTLFNAFDDNKGNKSKSQKMMENQKFNAQISALIEGLQTDGKKDIICQTDSMEIVMPTDENYFLNKNMSELTDGNYRILGKVTKICAGDGESISLLRNTAFSKLKLDRMKEFQDLLKDPSLSSIVDQKDIKTAVKSPTLMVIPIAIYI